MKVTEDFSPILATFLYMDSKDCKQEMISDDTIRKLSKSTIDHYEPNLHKSKLQIEEILLKQNMLSEQIHNENLKLSWTQNSVELQEMFDTVSVYLMKLKCIKESMRSIHERSTKLKKRAIRLQNHHNKEEYIKANIQKQ